MQSSQIKFQIYRYSVILSQSRTAMKPPLKKKNKNKNKNKNKRYSNEVKDFVVELLYFYVQSAWGSKKKGFKLRN